MNRTDRLQQAGVPIYATPGRRGGYALDTTHTLPPLNFTPGEVAAIATALSTNGATPFDTSGRSALRKILAVLRDVDADECWHNGSTSTTTNGCHGRVRRWRSSRQFSRGGS